MPSTDPPRALLDACVLAPLLMREMLFAFARAGLFTPLWSGRIEEEWRRAASKEARGVPEEIIAGDLALARAAFPRACAPDGAWAALEPTLELPDPNDRHVLAAAIGAEADLIVTDNVRDFPPRALAEHGLRRERADRFLRDLAAADEGAAVQAATGIAEAAGVSADETPAFFKRGRLPQMAKFLRGGGR